MEEIIDLEWVLLIKEAKDLGIKKEEILSFLRTKSENKVVDK